LKAQDTAPSCKFDTIQTGSVLNYRCVQYKSGGFSVATKRHYQFGDFYILIDDASSLEAYEETVNQCAVSVTKNDTTIPSFIVQNLRKKYASVKDINFFIKNLSEMKELLNIAIEGKKDGVWKLVLDDVFTSDIKEISYAPIDPNISLKVNVQNPIPNVSNYSEFRIRFDVLEKFSSYRFKNLEFHSEAFTIAAN
jgi:hypothetical protein